VAAVDLNNDNKLDLAVANLNAKTVAILLGNGDGTFRAAVPYSTTTGTSIGPDAIATGDFNGDGKTDLAISEQGNNTVSILLGNGNGSFQNPLEFSAGNVALSVAAGDFNADGRLDLAVANRADSTVSVLMHLPQPPTNLAATNVTATQVPLTWTGSTTGPVVNYNVYRSGTSGGPYTLQQSTPATSYTDSVASAHTYYYVVRTVTGVSPESVNSNEVSVTTP